MNEFTRQFHSGHITVLQPQQRFVFGSNEAGRHGAGAAKHARQRFAAVLGVGIGPSGLCYAIPTKSATLQVLPLDAIAEHVRAFLMYARRHPDLVFLLTPIGCGLAGYAPVQIAPLFADAPANVVFPPEFHNLVA